MRFDNTIILVDGNSRRRAAITHRVGATRFHAEPFESLAEVSRAWPNRGVMLVHDEGRPVRDLVECMVISGKWLPVVAYGEDPDARQVVEAVLDGALDYLAWPFDGEQLTTALDRAARDARATGNIRLREARARSRLRRLTGREREVLTGVAEGRSNRQIGEKLGISPRTVEIHRSNMLNKIGAQHTSEAIRVAIEGALIA